MLRRGPGGVHRGGRLKGGRKCRITETYRKALPQRLPYAAFFGSFLVRTQEMNTSPVSVLYPTIQTFKNREMRGVEGADRLTIIQPVAAGTARRPFPTGKRAFQKPAGRV